MKFVQQQLKFSSNCNTFLFPMGYTNDALIDLECEVNIDVLSLIIGPWGFQSILWTKAEGERARIATTPLEFLKIPHSFYIFKKTKLNIIFYRTDINLNNGLLIFLLKTYNLISVFLVLYIYIYLCADDSIYSCFLFIKFCFI